MIHSARHVANFAFYIWKVGTDADGRTDNMYKNSDPYRPWLWVVRVDQ